MQFTKSMFDSIKASMEAQKKSGNTKDILRTEPGNSYIIRLIPNTKDLQKTFYHYFQHDWNSSVTGQYIGFVCPTTYGERCPVCEERVKIWRTNATEDEKKILSRPIKRHEHWLVNAYVVKDPKNPDNEGKVKIFKFGKQVNTIINEAVNGEDADELGGAIFDLGPNGANFRIKVEKNEGDFPIYTASKFLNKGPLDPNFDQNKIDQIYNSCFDLDNLFDHKSYDDIKTLLTEHYDYNKKAVKIEEKAETKVETKAEEKVIVKAPTDEKNVTIGNDVTDVDNKIKDLLKDL